MSKEKEFVMLNLDKLLNNLIQKVTGLQDSLRISDANMSLSASMNYYLRARDKFYRYYLYGTTRQRETFVSYVSTATISTAGGDQTLYYWLETRKGLLTGYYLMYFGPIPTPSAIDDTKVNAYCYMDVPLPDAIATTITDVSKDGAIFTSLSNTRVLGCHGSLNGTATIRIYAFLTTFTALTSGTELNLFAYFPLSSTQYNS